MIYFSAVKRLLLNIIRHVNIILLILCATLSFSACSTPEKTTLPSQDSVSTEVEKSNSEIHITEIILGSGDKIEVIVFRHDDLNRTIQIDTSGKITYPFVGDIQAAGLSIFQLRDRISKGLSKYYVNPQVSVGIVSVQSQKVVVLGKVNNPGLFALNSRLTAIEAISKAGGFTTEANQSSILLIRGGLENPELKTLDIDKALSSQDMAQNLSLRNGDIVYVPATQIADVSRFFDYLSRIIAPILTLETGYYIGQQIEMGESRDTIVVQP